MPLLQRILGRDLFIIAGAHYYFSSSILPVAKFLGISGFVIIKLAVASVVLSIIKSGVTAAIKYGLSMHKLEDDFCDHSYFFELSFSIGS